MIKVVGLSELVRGMRKVQKDYPAQQREIHKRIATVVATEAEGRVRVRSGKLRKSIRPLAGQRYARVKAGRKGLDRRSGYDYSRINHFGGYPGRYKGNDFLYGALDATQNKAIEIYVRETDQLLDKAFKKI